MIYCFVLISDEVDNFRRDITIDSDATFFQLHEVILSSVNYTKDQLTSFFICNDDWSRETEITLTDMELPSNEDIYVMDSCRLSEFLNKEKQKLVYIFDQLNDRCFFIELCEIISEKNQNNPQIVKFVGMPPKQIGQIETVGWSDFLFYNDDESDLPCQDDEFEVKDYDDDDFENLSKDNTFDY